MDDGGCQAVQERSERHRGDLEDAACGRDEVPEAERAGATPRRVGREPNTETEFESTNIRSGTLPDSFTHLLTGPLGIDRSIIAGVCL